jgi:hypothetical protein
MGGLLVDWFLMLLRFAEGDLFRLFLWMNPLIMSGHLQSEEW